MGTFVPVLISTHPTVYMFGSLERLSACGAPTSPTVKQHPSQMEKSLELIVWYVDYQLLCMYHSRAFLYSTCLSTLEYPILKECRIFCVVVVLPRGIHLTLVQRCWGSTVKMLFSYTIFTFYEANTFVALPNACGRSVRTLS
jgi:hypothetical protein